MNKIWTNYYGEYHDMLVSEGYSEDELEDTPGIVYDTMDMYLEDEKTNLDIPCGDIICFADIQQWNGKFSAYKEIDGDNVNKIFDILNGDDFVFYESDGELMAESNGHDNPVIPSIYRFREIPCDVPNDNIDDMLNAVYMDADNKEDLISRYSRPMGHYASDVYGW